MSELTRLIKQLEKRNTKRGQLVAFCKKHGLSYNYVFRLLQGEFKNPKFDKFEQIKRAIESEKEAA